MKFESGNDRFSGVDPSSFFAHLHLPPFLSLSLSRNLQYRAIYLLQVPQPGQIHNIPIPYRPHDFWFVYVQKKHTHAPSPISRAFASSPSLLFDGPRSNTVSPSRFLAYHLNNANDWMGLEPRNPNEITFIVITIRHYAPRSTGVGGHTSAEIFTLLESLFSITSVSIFVSLFLSILNLSALIEKNSPVYAYTELGIIILW